MLPLLTTQAMAAVIVQTFLVAVFVFIPGLTGLEFFQNEKRAIFDLIPHGVGACDPKGSGLLCGQHPESMIKQKHQMYYSLSDFETELKKRVYESPLTPLMKTDIKQYFRLKSRTFQDVPLKKEWRTDLSQFIKKMKTL